MTGWGSKVGQALTFTLKRGSKVVKATATTRADASFTAVFRKNGASFNVKANDVIRASFATDAVMTVPTVTIGLLEAGIFGVCFPNAQAMYLLRDGDGRVLADVEVVTDEDGYWAHAETVLPGTLIEAWCANATGDVVWKTMTAP